jgi:hypothetical protein
MLTAVLVLQHPWQDMLWAPARLALKAVPGLKAGQLVSAMPGLMSLTRKVSLQAWHREWKWGGMGKGRCHRAV